jgi:CRISPR/Cas system CSM-associated protein Csm5 (group 7 of RAMP superfamily)
VIPSHREEETVYTLMNMLCRFGIKTADANYVEKRLKTDRVNVVWEFVARMKHEEAKEQAITAS